MLWTEAGCLRPPHQRSCQRMLPLPLDEVAELPGLEIAHNQFYVSMELRMLLISMRRPKEVRTA